VFRGENGDDVDLPTQIQERLDALGVLAADVEERFVRGSGPGGQKINKTSSTVCVKHRPTGVEVRCQRERSQAANRETAWTALCEKLEERLRAAEKTTSAGRSEGETFDPEAQHAAESNFSGREATPRRGKGGASWNGQ